MTIATFWRIVLASLAASLLAPTLAWACFYGGIRPSNFELVQIADAIVIAKPVSTVPLGKGEESFLDGKVRFEVTEVLKGRVAADVEVTGLRVGKTWASDAGQITYSHPEGHMGPCIRTTVAKGKPYILFLRLEDGAHHILGYPFSRVSEDYPGERGLWTRAIWTYLTVQRDPSPMAQIKKLEAMQATLRAKLWRTKADRVIAQDIADHLGSQSEWKPTAFLLRAYEDNAAGRPPRYPDRKHGFDAEGYAGGSGVYFLLVGGGVGIACFALLFVILAAFFGLKRLLTPTDERKDRRSVWRLILPTGAAGLVLGGATVIGLHLFVVAQNASYERKFAGEGGNGASAAELRRRRILSALLEGEHPGALPLFETLAGPDASPEELALAIRFLAKNGQHARSFQLMETRVFNLLKTAPKDQFQVLVYAMSEAQQDPHHEDGKARWKQDPQIAARWPGLALRVSQLADQRFEVLDGPDFHETLLAGVSSDYRATPELTLAVSGHSNEITGWADRELERAENLQAGAGAAGGTAADPLNLPLKIAVKWFNYSDGEDDEEFLRLQRVACLFGAQRQTVFKLLGELGSDDSTQAIWRFAASPELTRADREILAKSMRQWDVRHPLRTGKSLIAVNEEAQKIARGQPLTANDIAPWVPARCQGASSEQVVPSR